MKKIITLVIVICVLFSMSAVTFADTKSNLIEIGYEEYIKLLADNEGITIQEAIAFDNNENKIYESSLASRTNSKNATNGEELFSISSGCYTYYYPIYEKTHPDRDDLSASVTATFKVYTEGSFREIVSSLGNASTRIEDSGDGTVSWIQTNAWIDPSGGGYPTLSANYGGSGYFEKVTTVQLTGGAAIGWTLTVTIGENYYYRTSTMNLVGTYSVY